MCAHASGGETVPSLEHQLPCFEILPEAIGSRVGQFLRDVDRDRRRRRLDQHFVHERLLLGASGKGELLHFALPRRPIGSWNREELVV